MERKKILVAIIVFLIFVGVIIFFLAKNNKRTDNNILPIVPVNKEKEKSESNNLKVKSTGRIKKIEEGSLIIEDEKSPMKRLVKNGSNPTFTLKTDKATLVFLMNQEGKQIEKKISDIRIMDNVSVEYNSTTKMALKVLIFAKK